MKRKEKRLQINKLLFQPLHSYKIIPSSNVQFTWSSHFVIDQYSFTLKENKDVSAALHQLTALRDE